MSKPESGWRVAIVDSGLRADAALRVAAARRFVDDDGAVLEQEPVEDALGHGTRVAQVIVRMPRPPELLIAQALDARGAATPAAIAAAIDWSHRQGAQLVHLSLGLAQDRAVLARAVEQALRAGLLIVASAPARGALPYPAAYPGVMAATGDARCAREQISALGRPGADFGGCVLQAATMPAVARMGGAEAVPGAAPARGGASIGAAHLTRFVVQHLLAGSSPAQVWEQLRARATFLGRERRVPGD